MDAIITKFRPRRISNREELRLMLRAKQIGLLANKIREIDGSHTMSAGSLAEALIDAGVTIGVPQS